MDDKPSTQTTLPLEAVRRRLLLRGTGLTPHGFDDKRAASVSSIKRRQNSSLRHRVARIDEALLESARAKRT